MVYGLMLAFAIVVLGAAGAIYLWGGIGVAIVAAGIMTLPWTGRLLASLVMRLFVRGVLNEMAAPLKNAEVSLESLEPAEAPANLQSNEDYAEEMEPNWGERDWFLMELTITPPAGQVDEDGLPHQWDQALILPFIPSKDGRDDLNDAFLAVCEVDRCEVLHNGKWHKEGRVAYGPSRVRMHVGIPRLADRLRFLYCMQTVFGEMKWTLVFG
ncbi:MAG: hypothetical protein KDA93_27635, partial [Planctomycetaceae bacterium]|nr:hypothetical protein [Planctomycetaceae bacterium]